MARNLTIVMAQLNPTVGAISDNAALIEVEYAQALKADADILLTPELSLVGYPVEDLVLKPFFQRTVRAAAEALAAVTAGHKTALIIGAPWVDSGRLYNALLVMQNGEITDIRYKCELPNYGVFDEKRIFAAADAPAPVRLHGVSLGLMICEDMWFSETAAALAGGGAELLLVPTASPFTETKNAHRIAHAKARTAETGLPLIFCNQVGAQDELVFDGRSFVMSADGEIAAQMPAYVADSSLTVLTQAVPGGVWSPGSGTLHAAGDRLAMIYGAAVTGLKNYVDKNRFPGVVLGMSGGIDSALSAAIAVDALGADRVRAVMMPSRYTSGDSVEDAEACARALGCHYDVIAIKTGVDAFDAMLGDVFAGRDADLTEENIQSRLRGMLLMAMSNKFGDMVLTTGNKSEVSVGYATLYGDMCGGYNPLKDIYKMDVFALSRWRNDNQLDFGMGPAGTVIPDRIITKPPTAELREDQRDEDSLPPYERLDAILRGLVDEDASVQDLVTQGFPREEVARIEQLLYIAEYKRRQSAPGVKISSMLFGRDRRYPITNGFRSARFDRTNS